MPGSNPGFLQQQNTMRDAVDRRAQLQHLPRHADRVRGANIAQMVNVLQAMILTDGPSDGADADLPRLPDVRAVPGRGVPAGVVRGAELQPWRHRHSGDLGVRRARCRRAAGGGAGQCRCEAGRMR